MKALQTLVQHVSPDKLSQLAIPGKSDDEKFNRLYELVCEQEVDTTAEAADVLFGKTERYAPYQELTQKLKAQLANMLLLKDVNQAVNQDADKAYEECWRLATAAMLLPAGATASLSIKLADRAIKMAIEFEYAEIIITLAKMFRKMAGTNMGDKDKVAYYHKLYLTYEARFRVETRVAEYYERLMLLALQENTDEAAIAERGEQYFQELAPLLVTHDYVSVHRYIRFIQLTYLLQKRDYEAVVEMCEESLIFFESKKMDLRPTRLGFLSGKLLACTQLKEYKQGMATLATAKSLLDDCGQPMFFRLQELGLTLCLHNQAYSAANDLLVETLCQTALRQQPCAVQQQWKTYQAYLEYLSLLEKIPPLETDTFTVCLRLNKFLLHLPAFDKEKRDTNIPVLIIQVLLLMAKQRYEEARRAIRMLQRYSSRQLRHDQRFRTNCFINMLGQLPVAGFHRVAVLRYSEKYWKKLKKVSLSLANQSAETEIIPYEDLWEMTLSTLDTKRIRLK